MIVAVVTVAMVQVGADEVVDVVAVGDRLMSAPRPVDVVRVVPLASGATGAGLRVGARDRDDVLVDVVAVRVVQMPVVGEVDVPLVHDRRMPTAGAVDVIVRGVLVSGHPRARYDAPGALSRPGAHRPTGWRTLKPLTRRSAGCQRVPAWRCPEVSKRRPATTMKT